jgi:CheY-like chemotaxis protein
MKILIVDDEQINSKMLKFHIENFYKQNNIEDYSIDIAQNGLEALGFMFITQYNIMFLDVRMPTFDGIKVLNVLKNKQEIQKPYICMTTSLGEKKYTNLFELLKANSYIIKPINEEIIFKLLGQFLPKNEDLTEDRLENEDEFFDFDDDDTQIQEHTYPQISASEFVKEFENIDYILEDIEEIDYLLFELIDNLDIDTFEYSKNEISNALDKYSMFLRSLMAFDEISIALYQLNNSVESLHIENYEELKKNFIIELIRAILEDLSNWKNFVFVEQTAQDVHYINDSVLSNCAQLKELIS